MNKHSGPSILQTIAILLVFLSGNLSCAGPNSGQSEDSLSSSCAAFGTSADDLIAMDNLILALLEEEKYEAVTGCIAHQIELGYHTPQNYADLTIYLAYAGSCNGAKDSQRSYLLLMASRNENSPVPYSQMEDSAAVRIEEAIMACEETKAQ
ncbi:MAG: hypothetical protein V3S21_07425 [Xanthomonadales bacterium]